MRTFNEMLSRDHFVSFLLGVLSLVIPGFVDDCCFAAESPCLPRSGEPGDNDS